MGGLNGKGRKRLFMLAHNKTGNIHTHVIHSRVPVTTVAGEKQYYIF
jgi:hypothetical protein